MFWPSYFYFPSEEGHLSDAFSCIHSPVPGRPIGTGKSDIRALALTGGGSGHHQEHPLSAEQALKLSSFCPAKTRSQSSQLGGRFAVAAGAATLARVRSPTIAPLAKAPRTRIPINTSQNTRVPWL